MLVLRVLILSFLVVSGCENQEGKPGGKKAEEEKAEVKEAGKSELTGNFERGEDPNKYERMEFSADGNFVYDFRSDYLNGRTIGTWEIKENKVILNSYIEPPVVEDKSVVTGIPNKKEGFLLKAVDGIYGYGLPFVDFLVYGSGRQVRCVTDGEGECRLKDIEPERVFLIDKTYGSYLYEVPDDETEGLKFTLDQQTEYYRYFVNEEWILEEDKLIPPEVIYGEKDTLVFEKVLDFKWHIH